MKVKVNYYRSDHLLEHWRWILGLPIDSDIIPAAKSVCYKIHMKYGISQSGCRND